MKLKTIYEQNTLQSIMSKIPSFQDLISASSLFEYGKKSVIYPEEGGYITIEPGAKSINLNHDKYNEIVKQAITDNSYDIIVDGLRDMGFEISGEVDGYKVGRSNPQFQQQAKQFRSQVPTSSSNEVGGESGMTTGGLGATKRHVTGTPDHVEIPVTIDPNKSLEDTDDSFVYHTHPKMADNNYYPGRMAKGMK
jgi:hypothetical protein